MAKASNTFLKSKMNKDLDSRIISDSEYRNAVNVQVSKSEGDQVGSLENVLGNTIVADLSTHTGVDNLKCIGQVVDDSNGVSYLFFTNHDGNLLNYNPQANNYILSFNPKSNSLITLVKGAFLNFSTKNPIYGVNVLENLLFWTDNRNQPRKINISKASTVANYYETEDQISVAKYNPYAPIEMYDKSVLSPGDYETTMKDVSSFYMPNGGQGVIKNPVTAGASQVDLSTFKGDIIEANGSYGVVGATVSYTTTSNPPDIVKIPGVTVGSFIYNDISEAWEITVTGGTLPELDSTTQEIVLNANPYYNKDYAGDPTYLEDKFVRFGYRFKFDDDEYSLFSTFTQSAFIPKQDGYFMYVKKPEADNIQDVDDQNEAFRSTVVYFVENKVDNIKLRIPLPFNNYELESALKVKSIEILYKESDGLSVKVIDSLDISTIFNSAAVCNVSTNNLSPFTTVNVNNIRGGINVGDLVTGSGISTPVTVVSYTPDDPNQKPSTSGIVGLSSAQTLTEDTILTIGEPEYYTYDYQAKKPFKTLPEKDLIRVYDKIPVRSFAQEVSGNRVIYGNFQNKHTAPDSLNYNVGITEKSLFNKNESTIDYSGSGGTFEAQSAIDVDFSGELYPGKVVSSDTPGVIIPPNTLVSSTNNNGDGVFITGLLDGGSGGGANVFYVRETNGFIPLGAVISGTGVPPGTIVTFVLPAGVNRQYVVASSPITMTQDQPIYFTLASQTKAIVSFNNQVTLPAGPVSLYLNPGSDIQDTTSVIEYPNHSLKTNRNYQVGIVLSDRFGRQSGVILSNNKELKTINGNKFIGSTVYSPYNAKNIEPSEWRGNSLKVLFNETIGTDYDPLLGIPGVYNGDPTSTEYNPLGWYTFKIVVKQTEQEYYNVYLPGIMAAYPDNTTLELGKTSHAVLISDNINKVPRDLKEVGPVQDQFRSSVQLYGRVENSSVDVSESFSNMGLSNLQYYPGRTFDFASTVSTVNDLFNYNSQDLPNPNLFPQFYSLESNPYIARINTVNKIGQIANVNFNSVSALIAVTATTDTFKLSSISGLGGDIEIGDKVIGPGFPDDLVVSGSGFTSGNAAGQDWKVAGTGFTGTIVEFYNDITGGNPPGTQPIVAGQIMDAQAGVPEGTVVLSVDTNGGPPNNTIVELNNIVQLIGGTLIDFTEPDELVVSTAVPVTLGDSINVYSSESPGIQFLAVYETKPVESLLDIFWETSTTGRIKDVNDIITNENPTGTGAGGLSPWNDNVFSENLTYNEDCLAAPIYLVDNFGARVSSNDITSPLTLESAFNQQDPPINVQTEYISFGFPNPVFSFEETAPGSYDYMLKTDSGFVSEIYYGADEGARNFTLNFSAEVNGLPIYITKNISLGNERPHIPTSSGNSSTVSVLKDQTSVTDIKVYSGSDAIDAGWDVTTFSISYPLPAGLQTAGSAFTPPGDPLSSFGVINAVSDTNTFVVYNWAALAMDVDDILYRSTSNTFGSVPSGTYIVSKTIDTPVAGQSTITVNKNITVPAFASNTYATLQVRKPGQLQVSEPVTVEEGQILFARNSSEVWDDCPIAPFYPGGTNVRKVGELQAVNGAGWKSYSLFGNSKREKDLTFTKISEFRAAGTPGAQETDYFALENPGENFVGNAKIDLVNTGYQNANMPSDIYTITYEVSDPGDSVQCQAIVNTGLVMCEIQEWTLTGVYFDSNAPYKGVFTIVRICDPNGDTQYNYDANGNLYATYAYNGWYCWLNGNQNNGDFPSWNSLISSNGSNNIIINPTTFGSGYSNMSTTGWTARWLSLYDQNNVGTYTFSGLLTVIANNSNITGGTLRAGGGPDQYRWELTGGTDTNRPLVPSPSNYLFSVVTP